MKCEFCSGLYCQSREIPLKEYKKCEEFLLLIGGGQKINPKMTTYNLKHRAQEWSHIYVCGCTVARVASDLGFLIRRVRETSPNWFISYSQRGMRTYLEKNDLVRRTRWGFL